MEISFKWRFLGILFFQIPFITCFYAEYVIDEECKFGNETIVYKTGKLGSVGRLVATHNPPYHMSKECKIVIEAPADLGIVVSIQKIDFRQPSVFCLDYLKIYHSDVFFSPTTLCRFKFDLKENLSYFSRGKMNMVYHVQSSFGEGLNIEEGFSLTFTVVSEDMQDCLKNSMFMCDNARCLPKILTCDLRNNCGDNSDESQLLCAGISDEDHFVRMTDVLYGFVICAVFILVISSCTVIVTRRRKRIHDTDSTSDLDEPTTRLTPFQAIHPSGFFICQNPAGPATPNLQHSKIVQQDGGFLNPCYPSGMIQPPPPYSQ